MKPGQKADGHTGIQGRDINMGGDNDNQKNPFSMLINQAKKTFNG